jgi:predicted RNA-binding Zn-ribbon protein involved in translation (DUF1610 family)
MKIRSILIGVITFAISMILLTGGLSCDKWQYWAVMALCIGLGLSWAIPNKKEVDGIKLNMSPCPYCGGEAKLCRCGDSRNLFAYKCGACGRTPVRYYEGRHTEREARIVWNRRANND